MQIESLESLPDFQVKIKKKPRHKDSTSPSPKKKLKSPEKMSRIVSQMFEEREYEEIIPVLSSKEDIERKALENLRSMNDEFDTGSFELENEIKRVTETLPVQLSHRLHRDRGGNSTMSHTEQFPTEAEPELNRSKTGLVRLPKIPILKKTMLLQDYKSHGNIQQVSGLESIRHTVENETIKTIDTQEDNPLKTCGDLSPLITQNTVESNNDLAMLIRTRRLQKQEKRCLRHVKNSKSVKDMALTALNEATEPKETHYESASPSRDVNASIITKEEIMIHSMQRNTFNGTHIFRKFAIRGLLQREKVPMEALTLKTESVLVTDGANQGPQDILGYRPKNSVRGYLNLSKEETPLEEEKPLQGVGMKLMQFKQNLLPMKPKRGSKQSVDNNSHLRKQINRSMYLRPKADIKVDMKEAGRVTERDNSTVNNQKVEDPAKEVKEPRENLNKPAKTPVLNEIRENITLKGFNIFKSRRNKEKKEKGIMEGDPLISAPTSTRSPEDGSKKTNGMHARSKSSLFKTKSVNKAPSLLYILGSEREGKFKDFKKQFESKNILDLNVKKFFPLASQMIGCNPEELAELKQQIASRSKNRIAEIANNKSLFEERIFNHKKSIVIPEGNETERESNSRSQILDPRKEGKPVYTPKKALKPIQLCNKVGGCT